MGGLAMATTTARLRTLYRTAITVATQAELEREKGLRDGPTR